MKKQGRGWWIVGLAAALAAPALAPEPAAAGPFDYVKKADEQKNQGQQQNQGQQKDQEQQRRQAEERQQQERQRAAQENARQEQERRAASERQAAQARQAAQQQAQQQHQAEQQRQAAQAQQERARAAQEASQRQRAEQERAQQQAQQQRVHEEQAQREQARRFQEEQAARQQPRRSREEQRPVVRPVAAGPLDYIRKADETRGSAPANPPRAPAPPPGPAPAGVAPGPVMRPQPFNYIPGAPQSGTRGPGSVVAPFTPSVAPTYRPPNYRPSPFGTVRGGWPPASTTPRPQIETPRPPGSFPSTGSSYPRTYPVNPGLPAPFGSVRGHTESGTAVTPVPRGGHGTLGSYFGRPPHPHRERRFVPGPYYGYGYYPYAPGYYYVSPYDLYPPAYYYPEPSPSVVYVPEPEVIEVPEPYYTEPSAPRETEATTLDDVIGDIQEAWESGKLPLLMRHLRTGADIQIYRDGDWVDTLSRSQFEQKTAQAFRDYDTVSMTFDKPEMLGPDDTGAPRARARATHVYRTRSGAEQRVHVTYAFRKLGRSWYIVGLDYEPTARPGAAARESAPPAVRGAAPASPLAAGQLRLVSAPPVRLRDLLSAHQPRTLATVKWLKNGGRSLYTLQAMRGVVPGTMAWALYHKGEKRAAETGVVDVSALPASGWVAVRTQGPQLVTLSSRSAPRPRLALLEVRAFPQAGLALVPAKPPAKPAHSAKTRHKARQSRTHRAAHA